MCPLAAAVVTLLRGLWHCLWPAALEVTIHSPPLQDKAVMEILASAGNVITLTLTPTVIYEHMVKK